MDDYGSEGDESDEEIEDNGDDENGDDIELNANHARSDEVVDGFGDASQGYFYIACASEIEQDRSVFVCKSEY
jgi:hypothetical protein